MKHHAVYVIILSACIGCSPSLVRPPSHASDERKIIPLLSRSPVPHLKNQIDELLSDTLFPPAHVGIKIVSLTLGDTLYDLNSSMLFTPASNQKLFTSAAVLARLGGDFHIVTDFLIDPGKPSVLYVRGGGDPLFRTKDIDSVSYLLAHRLARNIPLKIVGDVSYFDDLTFGKGWMWDDEESAYNMGISPLSINGNSIEIQVHNPIEGGNRLSITTNPATDYITIVNNGRVADSVLRPFRIERLWRKRSNTIVIDGEMRRLDSALIRSVSVWQPEYYFLTLLAERLRQHGFLIDGTDIDTVLSGTKSVLTYSHRLDSAVLFMNKESDNLSAECVLKILAAERKEKPGTAENGIAAVKEVLAENDVDTTQLILVDGSGLSRYNLISPNHTIRLLTAMSCDPKTFPAFFNSLPVAGVDGTLANRMKSSAAHGNLRAKTGTLAGVSSLSGYVRTAGNELLAFSIMMQNFSSSARRYRLVQDGIGILLSQFRRTPPEPE